MPGRSPVLFSEPPLGLLAPDQAPEALQLEGLPTVVQDKVVALSGSLIEDGVAVSSTEMLGGGPATQAEPFQLMPVPEAQLEKTVSESSSTVSLMRRKVVELNGTENA